MTCASWTGNSHSTALTSTTKIARNITPNSPTFSQPVIGFHVDSVHSIPHPWSISARPSATVRYPPAPARAATAQS